jgi:tRNA-2-methylthio-N6-dimethylallyladenosine synthase
MNVLLDREGKYDGQLLGKSPYMQSVHVPGAPGLRGGIIPVRITGATGSSLSGEIVGVAPDFPEKQRVSA